jgi:hypothetical protein
MLFEGLTAWFARSVPPDHRRLFAANGGHVSAEPVAQDSLLAFADDNDEQTER